MNPIRLFIVDDHEVLQNGFQLLVDCESNLMIVGKAKDGQEALEQVISLQPDIILMDLQMPILNGFETTLYIRQHYPHIKVIILSSYTKVGYVVRALQIGALGYVNKNYSFQEIVQAIHTVYQGQRYLSPQVNDRLVDTLLSEGGVEKLSRYDSLSEREQTIFKGIVTGKNNHQIATELEVSRRTIEDQRRKVMKKLELKSLVEVMHYAYKYGIVMVEEKIP